jgi:hypothetical protein
VLERGHEQVAVTPADGRLSEIVEMPHESPWPPLLALSLGLVFTCLVIEKFAVAGLVSILCALCLLGWHSREPQEQ